jgi:hypothetical protein
VKNLDIKITILGMILCNVGLIGMIGCKKVEPPPPKPVNDVSERVFHSTGTIANIFYYENGYDKFFYDVQFNFTDGSVIKMDRLSCDHLPQIGESGKLYFDKGWEDKNIKMQQRADYLWVSDKKRKIEKSRIVFKTEDLLVAEVSKQHEWIDANNSSPNVFQLVLIKLDNKIITTGRFNESNKWQIETDKGRKSFNKYPSFKVIEWKEI